MKLASFEAVVKALNDAGVRYLVSGGMAVNAQMHDLAKTFAEARAEGRLSSPDQRPAPKAPGE